MSAKRNSGDVPKKGAVGLQRTPPGPADDREELRKRLLVVLTRRSRTDVAKLTGTSQPNVSRYAAGTRMPTEFSAALVRQLGVNPIWWLTGEGAPFIDDASKGAARLADELLEVVRGLNFVGQMRIGSLGGKHHLRVLRELKDALVRYEDLRARLNRRGVPILRALLDDLRLAIEKRRIEVARELAETADQILGFCDEPDLALELASLRGRLNHEDWQMESALEVGRRAISYAFNHGIELEERELELVSEYVPPLHSMGRNAEARRIAEAALTLASSRARDSSAALWLTAQLASMDVVGGHLRRGLATLTELRGKLASPRGAQVDGYLAQGLLLSGAFDVAAAVAFGGVHHEKAGLVLGFAAFMRDQEQIRIALDYYNRASAPRMHFAATHAELLLRALKGQGKAIVGEVRQFVEGMPASSAHPLPGGLIIGGDLYPLVGRPSEARKCFDEACRQMAVSPGWYSMGIMWQARHMRNALNLGTKAQQQEARDWFKRHVEMGYRCFAHLVE